MTKWLQSICDKTYSNAQKLSLRNTRGVLLTEKLWQFPSSGPLSSGPLFFQSLSQFWLYSVLSNWRGRPCICILYCCTIETSQVHCSFPSLHWRFNLEHCQRRTNHTDCPLYGKEASIKPSPLFPHFWFWLVSWTSVKDCVPWLFLNQQEMYKQRQTKTNKDKQRQTETNKDKQRWTKTKNTNKDTDNMAKWKVTAGQATPSQKTKTRQRACGVVSTKVICHFGQTSKALRQISWISEFIVFVCLL